jgi:hypothetical protein
MRSPHLPGLFELNRTSCGLRACPHARREGDHFRWQIGSSGWCWAMLSKFRFELVEVSDEAAAYRQYAANRPTLRLREFLVSPPILRQKPHGSSSI